MRMATIGVEQVEQDRQVDCFIDLVLVAFPPKRRERLHGPITGVELLQADQCPVPARLTGDAKRMAIGPKRAKLLAAIEYRRVPTIPLEVLPGAEDYRSWSISA